MRRDERQHLKENELAHTLEGLQEFVGPRARPLGLILIGVIVVGVVVLGVTMLRQRSQSQGQELLADALVALDARVVPPNAAGGTEAGDAPAAAQFGATGTFSTEAAKLNAALPKLKAAADAYPDAPAGITARYHMAGALAALGRHAEAIAAFDDVTKRAGANTLYGRMATLGKADAQARSGQLDAAITTWKTMAAQNSAELPVDAILIELGRAYVTKGNTADAKQTFTQIVDQHPDSPYAAEARTSLDSLNSAS
jgi:tetratricopeptide (TPR) repeat protein